MNCSLKKFFLLVMFSVLLGGCLPIGKIKHSSGNISWNYSDLRLLDPVDSEDPEFDLIAVYSRFIGKSLKIRLDFLDLVSPTSLDIFIPIDTKPGGDSRIISAQDNINTDIAWDYMIQISASGEVRIVDRNYTHMASMELLVSKDPYLDMFEISFNNTYLKGISKFSKFQVIIKTTKDSFIADQSSPVILSAPSPPQVKLSFIFWNALPSKTPAQTLRSWAGAHTGPLSSRHGLKYLLEAAESTHTPIHLSDLMDCEILSRLDYLGVGTYINFLAEKMIINVPRYSLCVNNDKFINNNILMYEYINVDDDYDYAHFLPCQYSSTNLSVNDSFSVSENLIRYKKYLVTKASETSSEKIILGGDFNNSWFGDTTFVTRLFTFIRNQPWILVETIYDSSYSCQFQSQMSIYDYDDRTETSYNEIYKLLINAPRNQVTSIAWQVFFDMLEFDGAMDDKLGQAYIGQVGHLLTAAKWVETPGEQSTCSNDVDLDDQTECVLSNDNIFMTIEPRGGYIPILFYLDSNGLHQIIGPTWEFALGLSDPTEWKLSKGVQSDPGQILGAFHSTKKDLLEYKTENFRNRVLLYSEDMAMRTTFTLYDNEMTASLHRNDGTSSTLNIPLVLDPWSRFSPGWGDKYSYALQSSGISWGYEDFMVEVNTNQPILLYPFNASKKMLSSPEDPNYDYSRAHYLPYPIALAEIVTQGDLSVELIIDP